MLSDVAGLKASLNLGWGSGKGLLMSTVPAQLLGVLKCTLGSAAPDSQKSTHGEMPWQDWKRMGMTLMFRVVWRAPEVS